MDRAAAAAGVMKPGLVIDTSGSEGLLAIVLQQEVLREIRFQTGRFADAAVMHSALASLLSEFGNLGKVIAGLGPGGHSSVRVGIATAIGVSIGLDIPACGVPSPYGFQTGRVDFVAAGKAGREEYWSYRVTNPPGKGCAALHCINELESVDDDLFTIESTLSDMANVVALNPALLSAAALCLENTGILEPVYLRPAQITAAKALPKVQWRQGEDQR